MCYGMFGEAVVVRSDRSCCVALRYVLAVEVRSVVLRQVEVWVGSVTAVPFRLGLTGFGWARCGKFRCGGQGWVRSVVISCVTIWRVKVRRSGSF